MDKKKNLLNLLEIYNDFGLNFVMDIKSNIKEKAISNIKEKATLVNTNNFNCYPQQTNETDSEKKLNQLNNLRKEIDVITGCSIKENATNTVFSDGNFNSQIMLIGEAPGANEDLEGIPFCGASGKLLDKMLASISLDRNSVYITNTVFWRPPNNRRPTSEEIEICKPFLEKHIAIIEPKIIILIGSTAVVSVMSIQENISKIRGKFYSYTNKLLNKTIPITAIFHPAYLMRQPMQKKLAWEDLKLIKNFIEQNKINIKYSQCCS